MHMHVMFILGTRFADDDHLGSKRPKSKPCDIFHRIVDVLVADLLLFYRGVLMNVGTEDAPDLRNVQAVLGCSCCDILAARYLFYFLLMI